MQRDTFSSVIAILDFDGVAESTMTFDGRLSLSKDIVALSNDCVEAIIHSGGFSECNQDLALIGILTIISV